MRNPADIALARPQVIGLLTLLGVLFGGLSYLDLPRQENPKLEERHAEIRVYLPGAEPAKVERLVTKIIEAKVAEVDDIQDIFSFSARGQSFVMVEVERAAPAARRLQEIRAKAQQARSLLPAGASDPEIDLELLGTKTMILALTFDRPLAPGRSGPRKALRTLAKDLKREAEQLPGVRSVTLQGLPEEEIEVAVDLVRLSQREITLSTLTSALAARNSALPSGEIELAGARSSVLTTGLMDGAEQVRGALLRGDHGISAVRIADVAQVERRFSDPEVIVSHNGIPAVTLALEMLDGGNALAFGERVRAWMEARSVPAPFRIAVVADEPTYIQERLDHLFGSLQLGMLFVASITLLGMGWRSGSVVSVSIPLSLVVAFGFMGLAGVEIQQLSIAAMVIGIGLVVDEAIVVTDSIQRHIDLGATPREAAVRGLGEIHLAILAGAATTVAAFIPLFLMQGDIGDFIRSVPLVVSLMLVGSVLVAHFVTPLLAVLVHEFRPKRRPAEYGLSARESAVDRIYGGALEVALRRPMLVLAGFALAFASSFLAIGLFLWPPVFFGDADRHQFLVKLRLGPVAPVEQTAGVVAEIGTWLSADPRVANWTGYAGSEAPKFYYNEFEDGRNENIGMLIVNTVADLPFTETRSVVDALNARFEGHVPGAWVRARALKQGYGGGSDIQIYLQANDLQVVRKATREIAALVRGHDAVVEVRDSFGYESAGLSADVDSERANQLGISHSDISQTLRSALDGVLVTTIPDKDDEIPIVVRLPIHQRQDADDLTSLPIYAPNAGRSVPLAQVAEIKPDFVTGTILRYDRQREGSISIDVEGRPIRTVTDEIEALVSASALLPDEVSIHYFGIRKEANESFLSLLRAGLVAIFLIYTILVIRFRSLSQPALVLLAIPMALIGSVWGLTISGMPLSFTAVLGMIALIGIVVNDAIVLLDYINQLRERGRSLEIAICEGARTRLRPVAMTSITTICGLLPLSIRGGDFWGPFGFVMIFGLAASTGLTLLILPATYAMLERRRRRSLPTHDDPLELHDEVTLGSTG